MTTKLDPAYILLRNNVRVSGHGERALVFAHGFGCNQNIWRQVAPAFEDNYTVVCFDYVGCGGSQVANFDTNRYASLDGYAMDILEVCDALNLNSPVIIGHSVSATIAALASNARPDLFDSIVMIGPSPCYIDDEPHYQGGFKRNDIVALLDLMDKNYQAWANYLVPIIIKNPDHPEYSVELENSFCSTDPLTARHFAKTLFFADNRADMEKISVPTFIMQCNDDSIAPEVVGRYLQKIIPRNDFVRLKASGHCPHVTHATEVIHEIRRYLTHR